VSLLSARRTPGDAASAAREFVRGVLDPVAAKTEEERRIPESIVTAMRERGYFGLTIPAEYGGVGLSLPEYLEVVREITRSNLAFEELIEENNGIGSAALLLAGSGEQKRVWLPRLASGEILGAFALTEPDAGSDAAAIRTTASPVTGGFVLNGRKHFITHGAEAGLITVVARSPTIRDRRPDFSLFLVTPDTTGFSVARVQPMMGYRASRHAELVFDDAFVPLHDVLGEPGTGFKIAMQTLDRGRLTVAADCLGVGEMLLDRTLLYAKERRTFGLPLAQRGQVREMLARSAIELFLTDRELFAVAERVEKGDDMRHATARLKLFASEAVNRIADRAMQIHGGFGYTVEAGIERALRDVRVMRIAEGASEILRATIARSALAEGTSLGKTAL
jgi:acyl-CoA dehydrogenase